MYVKDLCIRNVGPIVTCDVQPQFKTNGEPKPLLFVGANGSGKTILLSSVADALIQMASPIFDDIAKAEGMTRPMFRVCGSTNQRSGTQYSATLLTLASDDSTAQYIERTGKLELEVENELKDRFPAIVGQSQSNEPFHKAVPGFANDLTERLFLQNTYCFFPASRRESPHWQNVEAFPDVDTFDLSDRFKGRLGKNIIVTKSNVENLRWILDVVLDSRVDVRLEEGQLRAVQEGPLLKDHLLFGQARNNIEVVLQKILQNPNAKLKVGYRGRGSRLHVDLGNGTVIPSLSHLSLGQSVLFNLFCTIVRYADIGDLNKGHQLGQITGLAIIDEIEAHLHEILRFDVLPELISMFPKVQFIVATHSPSFLLGLDKRLGSDSYTTFEMPGGMQITSERFSEFQHSIEHMRGTAAFESAVLDHVKQQVGKPCILTEGDTDPDYIRCALAVLGRSELLELVEIDWVGAYDRSGNAFNTGDSALNAAAKLFQANPGLLHRRILLLYDCDTNKPDQKLSDLVWQSKVPENSDNAVLNKGIENLLPPDAVTPDDYDERTKEKDYGGSTTTRDLNKRRFCNRICREKNPLHFSRFDVIVRLVEELVKVPDAVMEQAEQSDGHEAADRPL